MTFFILCGAGISLALLAVLAYMIWTAPTIPDDQAAIEREKQSWREYKDHESD